jgi:hypothetical protein
MSTLVNVTALIVVMVLSASHARAESSEASLLTPDWSLARYTGQNEALARYAATMARYRERLVDVENSVGLAGPISPAMGERWTWLAADGSVVRRLNDGTFSLTAGDCVRILCHETTCIGAGWPLFVCEDDRQRKMSAPDFSTVIFDGVTFRRAPSNPPISHDEESAIE